MIGEKSGSADEFRIPPVIDFLHERQGDRVRASLKFGSVRLKIFAGMISVALLFLTLSVLIMNAFLDRIVDEEVRTSIGKSRTAYEKFSALSDELLLRQVLSVARTPTLKATMSIPGVDRETLLYAARDLHADVVGTDLFLLADARAKLLVDMERPELAEGNLRGFPDVADALAGKSRAGFWRYNDRFYRVAIALIEAGDLRLGIVVIGNLLSGPEASARLTEVTGSNVVILHGDRKISEARYRSGERAITDDEAARLAHLLRSDDTPATLSVVLGGEQCLACGIPAGQDLAHLVLFRSLDEIADKVAPIRDALFIAGGGSVLLAIVFSFWLTRRVTGPILRLKDVVEQFGAGNRSRRAERLPSDEIGLLGGAFNRMAEDLERTTVSRDYFNNILRSMVDTLVVLTPDARVAIANDAALRLLDYADAELAGRPMRDLLKGSDATEPMAAWLERNAGKATEMIYAARGGAEIPVSFAASLLHAPDGRVLGFICVAQDLREFHKLQGEKLRAEKLASVGSMAAIMAHEVKNRLAVISGAADILRAHLTGGSPDANGAERAPEKFERVFALLEREIQRAAGLISDLLTYARPKKPVLQPVDIRAVIVNILELKSELLQRNRIAVSVAAFPRECRVVADARQIEQAFMNVILNAIEAQPDGGSIAVTAEEVAGEKPRLRITVADAGRGMDDETRRAIFEPFFTTKEFGTGLGLVVCRSLIQEHHGSCMLESRPGEGTRVVIELPLIV